MIQLELGQAGVDHLSVVLRQPVFEMGIGHPNQQSLVLPVLSRQRGRLEPDIEVLTGDLLLYRREDIVPQLHGFLSTPGFPELNPNARRFPHLFPQMWKSSSPAAVRVVPGKDLN